MTDPKGEKKMITLTYLEPMISYLDSDVLREKQGNESM